MTALWLPGAERLASSHVGGRMAGGPPRVVWHRTVGQGFRGNARFLKAEGFEPHILWDPTTGELGQFLPANRSAYALEHRAGTPETNRAGSMCIQIEVADHGKTWDITSTAMKGWPSLRAWLRDLGIPETWPGGPPPPLGSRAEVSARVWLGKAGHYSHSQVPHNDHTDPGRMDLSVLFPRAAAPAPAVKPAPPPAAPAPAPLPPALVQEDDMAARIKKANNDRQYLVTPQTGAVPIEDPTELGAWSAVHQLPDLQVLPDAQVDALVRAAAARR